MPTLPEMRDTRFDTLDAAADAWIALAAQAEDLAGDSVAELARPLEASGWEGDAAASASAMLSRADDKFELLAIRARTVGSLLGGAADELRRLQQLLRTVLMSATANDYVVGDDGSVTAPPLSFAERHDPDHREIVEHRNGMARDFARQIGEILTRASDADGQCARALAGTADVNPGTPAYEYNSVGEDAREAAEALGLTEGHIPPAGTDPKTANTWWNSLTDDQRHLYATAWPDRVGVLDGLPATARDEANQLALRNYLGDNVNTRQDSGNAQHDRALTLLQQLEGAEDRPADKRFYLLGFEPLGDGKAVVAIGDPDTAAHTAVAVPGVGTELDEYNKELRRAQALHDQSSVLAPGQGVSVIAWLGYDPPGDDASGASIATAPFGGKSEEGARALDAFTNGLRASHDGSPQHITLIGHSYGSTVLGEAASNGDGIAADDLIVAGSPGMRVDHVSELTVPADHVWATAAADDNFVARPENLTKRFIPEVGGIPIAPPGVIVLGEAFTGVHGPAPHDAGFGANVLHADTHGHSGYWEPDSRILKAQASVIVGEYGEAREYGRPQ